jgi:hypothetical protein
MMNTNRYLAALALAVSSACLGSAAKADLIPYPDAGTPITVPSYISPRLEPVTSRLIFSHRTPGTLKKSRCWSTGCRREYSI